MTEDVDTLAADPGANTARLEADKHTAMAVKRLLCPDKRFKSGNVLPGTSITIISAEQPQSFGRPNEVRVMHTLVTDQLICVLGPSGYTFTKSGDAGGNFKITNGRELRAAKAVPSGAYSVGAAAVNAQAEAGSVRTVTIFVDPRPPTNIALSANTVSAAATVNTVVGNLTSTDPEVGDTFTYSIDDPSGCFKIVNDQILTAKVLTGLQGAKVTQVTSTDAAGLAFTKAFTITVT